MRQYIRPRREPYQPKIKTIWAVGVFLSISVASGFQPNSLVRPARSRLPKGLPYESCHQFASENFLSFRMQPLAAVTDPEVLLSQIHDDRDWTAEDRRRIEMLYALASAENKLHSSKPESDSPQTDPVTVRNKRAKSESLETKRDSSDETGKIQFKGISTTIPKRKRRRPSSLSMNRSSTMPGFAAESGRQRAYRDGLRLAEKQTGRKIVESAKSQRRRRKENGEYMYRTSASVPDSMLQFAEEIHQEDRITRTEEIELGMKTQEAIRLQLLYNSLQETLDREPTDQEWCAAAGKINMEAVRQAIEEGLEAKNKLVTSNLRLVQSVVNTYIRNGLSAKYNVGDMMQDGIIALIRAAEKFEPDRGWKFSTYAMYWVRASVKRNQVSQSRVINVPHRMFENHKRLTKIRNELTVTLDRQPTLKEVAKAADMTEQQVERCLTAMAQRCFSLDQELTNGLKPMSSNNRNDRLVDVLEHKSEDSEENKLQSLMLREDLIETLHRHLGPEEVELLLFRYGLKELPASKTRIGGQPTIAELSRTLGLKPDKVRRMINKSLQQLRSSGTEEWKSFQKEFY